MAYVFASASGCGAGELINSGDGVDVSLRRGESGTHFAHR